MRKTSPGLCSPADDEDTDRIAAGVLSRLSSGAEAESPAALTIERYVNVEVHAFGGMGRVFVAYDPVLDRTVALKALPVGLSPHEPAAAVSRREGKALAGIDHPNVVHVYEMIEHRGLDCLVLEHVSGVDLGVWLKSARRDWRAVLPKFLRAGDGLAAVHRAGLIHRDFKPANVVVGQGGVVKLVDFGLAVQTGALAPGDPEICAGTPRFMAPEQIQGKQIGPYSDQYSFCVALYEALFGVHPYLPSDLEANADEGTFTVSSQAVLHSRRSVFTAILRGALQRPARLPPGLPARIRQTLLRGLSLEPERRFPSMEALLTVLRRDPWRARRRWLLGVGAAATISALSYGLSRPEVCRDQEELMAPVWNGRRPAIAQKLERFGHAPLDRLDSAARELANARREDCVAEARGERRDTDQARSICIQARSEELSAVLGQLERGDDATVVNLVGRFDELPSARECNDIARLRYSCASYASLPLAQSKAEILAGRFTEAERLARVALEEALARGAIGPEVLARVALGRIAYDRSEWSLARSELTQAQALAEKSNCFTIAAEGYHWLTKMAALDPQAPLALAEEYSRFHEWRISEGDITRRADVLNNRALIALFRTHDLPRAEVLLRQAIGLRGGEFDETVAQADSYLNLASVLQERGEHVEAEAALDNAQARREAALGKNHPLLYKELLNRGNNEADQGRFERAISLYKESLRLAMPGMSPEAPVIGGLHLALARAHDRVKDRGAALAAAKAAAEAYKRLPADDLRRSEAEEAIAQTLIADEDYKAALPRIARAEEIVATQAVVYPDRRGHIDTRWAEALGGLKRHADSERRARSALAWYDRAGLSAGHPQRASATLFLAEALLAQGQWLAAMPLFQQAVALLQATRGNEELLAWTEVGLAKSLCRRAKRRDERRRIAQKALLSLSLIDPVDAGHLSREVVAVCGPP